MSLQKISMNQVLIFAAAVLVIANGLFIWKTFFNKSQTQSNLSSQPAGSSNTQPVKILYGQGNAVIYESNAPHTFSGSGLVETRSPINQNYIGYVVGLFNGWENINNSSDKYILVKDYKSGKIFKIRTKWSSSTVSETLLVKEDISKIRNTTTAPKYLTSLGTVSRTEQFKKNSIVAVLLETTKNGKVHEGSQKDANGEFIANAVAVR